MLSLGALALVAMATGSTSAAAPTPPEAAPDAPASPAPSAASPPKKAPTSVPPGAKAKGEEEVPGRAEAEPGSAAPSGDTADSEPSPEATSIAIETVRASAVGVELAVGHFKLANGLSVYVVEDHSVPTFAMSLAYGVGSRDEVEGRSGFAHLFEHMMFKGSANVPDGGHFQYVSRAGGELNAFTNTDYTLYYDVLPSNYLEPIMWLESDRMRSLEVSDENFENQRSAVFEELAMRYENAPYAMAFTEFLGDVWQGTVYGHLPIGNKEDLASATAADAREFYQRYYTPNNAVMAVVGDVKTPRVAQLVQQYFGDIPKGPPKAAIEPIDHTPTPLTRKVEDPLAQQAVYALGWKTVPENHPDEPALNLLFDILLHGESSKIARLLVDDRKLAIAAVPMSSGGGRDAGSEFAAFVPTSGVTMKTILDAVAEELAKLKKSGVSAKDLEKAKNQRTVGTIGRLATNQGRAVDIATGALLEQNPAYALKKLEAYTLVTPADIQRVAKQYLGDQTLQLEVQPPQQ